MLVFRLALRAIAWRAAASATVFAVALIGILAAAVGPIYLHAVDETVLAERLTRAPQQQRDLQINRATAIGTPEVDYRGPVHLLADQAADRRWFAPPVFSDKAEVYFQRSARYAGQLAAIDNFCAHVRLVAGRCFSENSAAEVVISARTARDLHLKPGMVIKPVPVANVLPIRLRIVGVVTPVDLHGTYWEPWDLFDATPTIFDSQLPRLDSFFVSQLALSSRTDDVAQTVGADVRLVPAKVHLDDLPALRAHVREIQDAAAAMAHRQGPTDVQVDSQVAQVLDGMRKEMSLARTLITLPTAQLVLLGIFVLYAVVAGTANIQGPEAALAKLRGRRVRSVLAQGVLQPVILTVLAAPAAALLAWLIVSLLAGHLLATSVPVVFPSSALLVVGLATAGGVLAAVIAARRIVVAPVGSLLRRGTDPSGSSLGLALADATAVALALAGLVELAAGGVLDSGDTDPLSAVAPTLIGIALAVVAVRLLPYAGRAVVRWTRDSPRLAAFLAVRQIVRRPAGARVLILVGVALALATFAVTNWSVARSNRELRALNATGASTVLDVAPQAGVDDLRIAVARADPAGHSMAAALVQADAATPLLAVDTSRFTGVAAWRTNYAKASLDQVLKAIGARSAPSISFAGRQLGLDVDVKAKPRPPMTLRVFVTGTDHRRTGYDLGRLTLGRHTYVTPLAPVCRTGCRITGLTFEAGEQAVSPDGRPGPAGVEATISARARTAAGWQPIADFGDRTRWRSDEQGIAQLDDRHGGLGIALDPASVDGPLPVLLSADTPAHLPAVVASGTASAYPGAAIHDVSATGLDGVSVPLDGVAPAVSLPEADRFGAMVDFGAALTAMTERPANGTRFQVWLAASAPKDLPARLAAQGVVVIGKTPASRARAALDHTGPAFAEGLFLIAAGAATVLAVGATVLGAVINARRRAYELAALAAVGVAPRVLRRATVIEQGIVLGAGLAVGLIAGLGGAVLALPSTPFFVDDRIGPPSDHGLPFALVAGLAGALVIVFAVTCLIVARLVSKQATVGRLREAQQ